MTCSSAREAILDFARDESMSDDARLAVEEHLGACANCVVELERQRSLTTALNALAAEAETWKPSPGIERRLQEAFVARTLGTPIPQSKSRGVDRWVYALAGAAVVALAVWLGSRPSTAPPAEPARPTAASAETTPRVSTPLPIEQEKPAPPTVEANVSPGRRAPVRAAAGRRAAPSKPVRSFEFITLPGAAGLPDLESGSVVRVAVPVASLPEYGLDIVQGESNTTVDADVPVGQDGLARAIRLVSAEELATQDTRSRR
jgi:hypothetical protein